MRVGPMEIILILGAVGALVGTQKLPKLGKAAGEAVKTMKDNTKEFTEAVKLVDDEMKDIKGMVALDTELKEKE